MDPGEQAVETIPGIGIIRARSLKKAGWNTVAALGSATVEDLLAVPGITEIKAAQILQFAADALAKPASMDGLSAAAAEPAVGVAVVAPPPRPTRPEEIAITFEQPDSAREEVPVYTVVSPRDLMQDVALSAQLLLTSELASKWSQPFAAQLGKLISLHEKWDQHEPIGKKRSKQIMELLEKVHRLLTETPIAEMTKRKSQEHLAEVLRDRRRRIRDLLKG